MAKGALVRYPAVSCGVSDFAEKKRSDGNQRDELLKIKGKIKFCSCDPGIVFIK
ncbi:MAG: hypothetical protein RHS_2530 [Robinsoniella sp. RHS]|nr:MAG: hypothetical protein RHS_2530 [Robinsoniella sp. RHS]